MKKYLILSVIISVFLTQPVWALTSSEVAKLVASDGDTNDYFGYSVAIDVDTAVIGAFYDDDQGANSGSVYVYTHSEGLWTEQAKLLASDGVSSDYFGRSVAIEGDKVVIGAYGDGISGSAYVYTRSEGIWTEQQKLIASDGRSSDYFGISVAIDGDTTVIGAYGDDTPRGTDSGSAYIFTSSEGGWTEQARLLASDGKSSDRFGVSVSIQGDTVVIGAYYGHDDQGTNSGSAYVYTRSGTIWSEQAKLLPSDGDASDYFGYSVAIDVDTAVIGARYDDDQGTNSGSAYVYTRSEGIWIEEAKLLASDGDTNDYFGISVAVEGEMVAIGASGVKNDWGSNSGAAYIYTRSEGIWTEQEKLFGSYSASGDQFGNSVAIGGDTTVIGAYGDDYRADGSGTAYIFYLPYNQTPTVPDTTAPIITSGPTITAITMTTATVSWETDEPSSSVVSYGVGSSLGSSASTPGYTTEHSVVLTGLTDDTQYNVNVTSVDEKGNESEVSTVTFTTLPDTISPVFTNLPEDKTVEVTGINTYVSLGTVTAKDNISAIVMVDNNAPTSGFPLGATTVTWSATDMAGNTSAVTQLITVQDTTAPVLTVPEDVTIKGNKKLNIVDFGSATAADISGSVIISNDAPAEGFPRNSTTMVTWIATDASGNTVTATQLVTITNKKVK